MVMIKDMAMPACCEHCLFDEMNACIAVDPYVKKIILRKKGELRPEWCPLTEVEPYGPDGVLYREK